MTSVSFVAPIQRIPKNIGITLTYKLESLRYVRPLVVCVYISFKF